MIEYFKIALLKQKRLIALFLLTIFLPSIVLSVFGIKAIRNEQFHQVEQIENEHKITAVTIKNRLTEQFDKINVSQQVLAEQSSFLNRDYQGIKKLINTRLGPNPLIEQVFIQYEGADPFFPLFQSVLKKQDLIAAKPLNESQRILLTRAEESEFEQKNYKNAIAVYRKIFSANRDRNVKAQMLGSIARNYKKMKNYRSAIQEYKNIRTNYSEYFTSSGLSLGLISKLQIIECNQQLNKVQNTIKSALELYNDLLENPWDLSKNQYEMYSNIMNEMITKELNLPEVMDSLENFKSEFKKFQDLHIEKLKQWQIVKDIQNEIIPELQKKITLEESWQQNTLQQSKTINGLNFLVLASRIIPESGNNMGLVGLKIKNMFLLEEILPTIIKEIQDDNSNIVISDYSGNVILGEKNPEIEILTTTGFFIDNFPPWRIEIYRSETPSLALHKSFYFWTILTLILILTFGSLLIVRTVSHEMELLKIKSDFVSSVSHELKTPLTSIKALTERLLDGKVKKPEKMKEYYSYIIQDAERLSRLVKNVLDFSKIEEGKKEYEFTETDMTQWFVQTIENFQKENIQRRVKIQTRIEENIPRIQIDQDAMAQAFTNILDNAYKFSLNKKEIKLILVKKEENVHIIVNDYGIGIPLKELDFIFEKFYQGKYGLKHSVKGTGLGLTLVHHIIEAHKGKITVESKVDHGTKFTIILPIMQKNG
jgi:signal transduction histidine kinase